MLSPDLIKIKQRLEEFRKHTDFNDVMFYWLYNDILADIRKVNSPADLLTELKEIDHVRRTKVPGRLPSKRN
jgi:hypothetical protein